MAEEAWERPGPKHPPKGRTLLGALADRWLLCLLRFCRGWSRGWRALPRPLLPVLARVAHCLCRLLWTDERCSRSLGVCKAALEGKRAAWRRWLPGRASLAPHGHRHSPIIVADRLTCTLLQYFGTSSGSSARQGPSGGGGSRGSSARQRPTAPGCGVSGQRQRMGSGGTYAGIGWAAVALHGSGWETSCGNLRQLAAAVEASLQTLQCFSWSNHAEPRQTDRGYMQAY